MKVRNNSKSPIGIGSIQLLPDKTAEFPEDHPAVISMLEKKLLVKCDSVKATDTKTDGVNKQVVAVKKMNIESLRKQADELGIAYTEADPRATLLEKVLEKLQAKAG